MASILHQCSCIRSTHCLGLIQVAVSQLSSWMLSVWFCAGVMNTQMTHRLRFSAFWVKLWMVWQKQVASVELALSRVSTNLILIFIENLQTTTGIMLSKEIVIEMGWASHVWWVPKLSASHPGCFTGVPEHSKKLKNWFDSRLIHKMFTYYQLTLRNIVGSCLWLTTEFCHCPRVSHRSPTNIDICWLPHPPSFLCIINGESKDIRVFL